MTGLKTAGLGWLGVAGAVSVWQGLITVYGEFLGLTGIAAVLAAVATILTSVPLIAVGARRWWLGFRKAGRAVNAVLGVDEKLDEHREESREQWRETNRRFAEGDERMESIEGGMAALSKVLETLATTERAAVKGAVEAMSAPRPPRRTDPEPRTGWRE